jgi:hypothetical protein
MSTHLLVILTLGAAMGCWAALTLMGGERARRIHQLQAQRPGPAPQTPHLSVSGSPVGVAQAAAAPPKAKAAKPQAAPVGGKNVR